MVKPTTCCGRADSCVCAEKATCSCGKQSAMNCTCEKKATENTVAGARCSCRTFLPHLPPSLTFPWTSTDRDRQEQDQPANAPATVQPRRTHQSRATRVRVESDRRGAAHVRRLLMAGCCLVRWTLLGRLEWLMALVRHGNLRLGCRWSGPEKA